ncbi:MAG: DeoR family transcriptional regulator [Motilibacteraceae bacterium]
MSAATATPADGTGLRSATRRRRAALVSVLRRTGYLTLEDARLLAAGTGVGCSEATLRRDLAWVAEHLLAQRVHGGVVLHPLGAGRAGATPAPRPGAGRAFDRAG